MNEFTDDFYLELLRYFEYQFSTNYPEIDFYWGKNDSGNYYWGDKNAYEDLCGNTYFLKEEGLDSVKEVVESIFKCIGLE